MNKHVSSGVISPHDRNIIAAIKKIQFGAAKEKRGLTPSEQKKIDEMMSDMKKNWQYGGV